MPRFIIYACPQGPLAEQVQDYLDQSRGQIGRNAAHAYQPHCTLTGFFEDDPRVVPGDLQRLEQLVQQSLPSCPHPPLQVRGLSLQPGWLGLNLDSPWLKQLVVAFATTAKGGRRQTPITPKSWLHLTLANDFPWAHQAPLTALARGLVNPGSAVSWELRYYQRDPEGGWHCHQAWPLPGSPARGLAP